jgi:hypothetical protein
MTPIDLSEQLVDIHRRHLSATAKAMHRKTSPPSRSA